MPTKQSSELVRQFIRALVTDLAEADALLQEHPSLLNARCVHEATVIHYMTTEGSKDGVFYMASRGADVDAKNQYGDCPLIDASILGDFEIAKILLDHGANPGVISSALETPIICAVRSGAPELVELLIQHGADPEYRTPTGKTIFDVLPRQNKPRLAIYKILENYSSTRSSTMPVSGFETRD